ncbi:hypothetical protein HGP13_17865 [Mesorhizobium sp. NZP2077]|uniref:hypothetical protein n=1 Tax=Mesorhizobium sp. NZP2077 TaxID=2483404 RepID=UPI001551F067|nr:hypothetical protein [Mesorhizobium sp. NZP2077]QKD16786.1 hypothetical protein HGP13_17865 [Mesorhizobium sp. NZP2077]
MRTIKKGATSQSVYFDVLDSTSTTGGRKTGLAFNTSSLVAYYVRNQGTATAITLATLAAANTAWSSGGFKEVDATNMPGIYRLDVPDAAFATGAGDDVVIVLKGATGMVQASVDVQLVAWDPQDSVRAGLTALPNAAAEAAGGLYTRGTGAGQINQDANGRVDANAKAWAGTATTLTSGLPDVNMKTITAGIIAAASFAANALDAVWSTATRVLTAGTNIALAKGTGVTGFNDLSAAEVNAEADTALSDAGVTSVRQAHLDADVSSRSTYAGADTAGTTTLLSRLTNTRAGLLDHLDADISSRMATFSYTAPLDAAGTRSALGLASANFDTQIATLATSAALTALQSHGDSTWSTADVSDLPTNAELATALAGADDATLAAIASLSSGISASFTSLASYGDSHWSTATGFATVNPDNAGIAAIQERTDNLPDDPADASVVAGAFTALQSHGDGAWATGATAPTADAIADEVETRTLNANMTKINGTALTGDGSSGDKFGPA